MSVYSCSFYIAEEKRFVKWDEYIAFYKQQDKGSA